MKKLNLWISGASGFLGRHLCPIARTRGHRVKVLYHKSAPPPHCESLQIDLQDFQLVRRTFKQDPPDAVLHLAALSDPQKCQNHPELSKAVNLDSTLHLAELCAENNSRFVFTSTDLVFDGRKKGGNYNIHDKKEPLMTYGKHKSEAEARTLEICPNACVCRMPLMYGVVPGMGAGQITGIVQALKEGRELKLFTDEMRNPTYAGDAAAGLLMSTEDNREGVWHLASPERLSRYDFALRVALAFGFGTELLIPLLQSDVQLSCPRPADVTVNSEASEKAGYVTRPAHIVLPQLALLMNHS